MIKTMTDMARMFGDKNPDAIFLDKRDFNTYVTLILPPKELWTKETERTWKKIQEEGRAFFRGIPVIRDNK